jgi:hypothetical protein
MALGPVVTPVPLFLGGGKDEEEDDCCPARKGWKVLGVCEVALWED